MRIEAYARHVLVAMGAVALALGMGGCLRITVDPDDGKPAPVEIESTQTDEMFDKTVGGSEFYVFQLGDETRETSDYHYSVDLHGEELQDGHFYKVVADVTYLNGGMAGYVDYPQIEQVISCEEVSPFDMGLPSTEDKRYGLTLIGDYADGDVLYYGITEQAVWKDGEWVYTYGKELELPDGTEVAVRSGVTEDEVQAGIKKGVLSCEDYFVLPPKKAE